MYRYIQLASMNIDQVHQKKFVTYLYNFLFTLTFIYSNGNIEKTIIFLLVTEIVWFYSFNKCIYVSI